VRKTAFVLAAASILSAAAIQACGSDSGDDDPSTLPGRQTKDGGEPETSSGSSGTPAPPPPPPGSADCSGLTDTVSDKPACDTCAKQKCCDAVQGCLSSSDCKALEKCLEPCADDDFACILGCQSAHDKGSAALEELGSCASDACESECGSAATDGGLLGDAF
jgi:hypothetical protein